MKDPWNYRVLRDKSYGEFYKYSISEVLYSGEDGIIGAWTNGSLPPMGSTLDDLKFDLQEMLEALNLPVLEEKNDTLVEVEDN